MKSTPVTRAAKRDFWTRADVEASCKALDYTLVIFAVAALMALGSLFN